MKKDRTDYSRAYYLRNRDRIIEYQRRFRAEHPERLRPKPNPNPPLNKAGLPNQRWGRRWGEHKQDKQTYMRAYDQLPERKAARRKRYKERGPRPRPGWTRELRAQVLLDQNGNCAICETKLTRACQDHDARTNKPRGLLCTNCNHLLGKAKDSIETLERAIAYLRKYA